MFVIYAIHRNPEDFSKGYATTLRHDAQSPWLLSSLDRNYAHNLTDCLWIVPGTFEAFA